MNISENKFWKYLVNCFKALVPLILSGFFTRVAGFCDSSFGYLYKEGLLCPFFSIRAVFIFVIRSLGSALKQKATFCFLRPFSFEDKRCMFYHKI